MNQIPNIEETHNTRGIDEIDVLNKLRDLFGSLWQEDKNGDPTWEVTVEVASAMHSLLHHQLQKAREEAVTRAMDEMLEYTHLGEQFIDGVRTLIEARGIKLSANHSELDQDKK